MCLHGTGIRQVQAKVCCQFHEVSWGEGGAGESRRSKKLWSGLFYSTKLKYFAESRTQLQKEPGNLFIKRQTTEIITFLVVRSNR